MVNHEVAAEPRRAVIIWRTGAQLRATVSTASDHREEHGELDSVFSTRQTDCISGASVKLARSDRLFTGAKLHTVCAR